MIVFDVLRRTFEYLGNDVTFVSNYTDVDDQIIKAAKAEGITEKELTDKYIKAYEDVRAGLNIEDPTYKPRVTETMPEIIDFIQALIDKGYAYEVDGDVYFRVTKVKEYGMLSGIKVEDLIAGASDRTLSVDDKKKESTTDFALWKKTNEGIQFDTPWSKGRPGLHTESVVMINKLFKDGKIDIHGGGQDLKFPHHENEIAQAKAMYGNTLASYLMHVGRLNLQGQKMSKSLGNVILVNDFKTQEDLMSLRLLIVTQPYRNSISYDEELFNQYKKEYDKFTRAYKNAMLALDYNNYKSNEVIKEDKEAFINYMNQDLNCQNVMSLASSLLKELNSAIRAGNLDVIAKKANMIKQIMDVFGVMMPYTPLNDETRKIYNEWVQAKSVKNFEEADKLRAVLTEAGVI